LMNRIAGTKFKMIRGYRGVTGTVLAMERSETEGAHATLEQIRTDALAALGGARDEAAIEAAVPEARQALAALEKAGGILLREAKRSARVALVQLPESAGIRSRARRHGGFGGSTLGARRNEGASRGRGP